MFTNDAQIHIVFLNGPYRKEDGYAELVRPMLHANLDDLGLTFEQAQEVCRELSGNSTINAFLTSGGREL